MLEQLALAELLGSGAYEKHVRAARLGYRRRRDQLVSVLARRSPRVQVTGIAAGLHVVLTVPGLAAADEPSVCQQAARRDLVLHGLDQYRMSSEPEAPASFVVGYSRPRTHDYGTTLELLGEVLADVS